MERAIPAAFSRSRHATIINMTRMAQPINPKNMIAGLNAQAVEEGKLCGPV